MFGRAEPGRARRTRGRSSFGAGSRRSEAPTRLATAASEASETRHESREFILPCAAPSLNLLDVTVAAAENGSRGRYGRMQKLRVSRGTQDRYQHPVRHSLNAIIEDGRAAMADLWRDGRGWVLVAVSAGWFLSLGVRFVYPALIPFFRTEFGMPLSTAGLLLTLLWTAYALGQLPGGVLGDRYGEGNMLVFSTVLSTIAVAAVATSANMELLFAGTIAFGFATALFGPLRFTILTTVFPERTGSAVGITMAAGNVGNAVLPFVAGLVAVYASWRLSFGLAVPLFASVAVVLWLTVPGRPSTISTTGEAVSVRTVRRILADIGREGIPAITLIQILMGFATQGFLSFYPTYLIDVKGVSLTLATTLFGLLFTAAIGVQLLTGVMQDRFGAKRVLIGLIGVFFVSLAALPFTDEVLPLVVLTVLLSSRAGSGVIANTFIADTLPVDTKGTGLGFLRTCWILVGASSPIFIGALGDRGLFEEAFGLLAVVAGSALLVSLFILPEAE